MLEKIKKELLKVEHPEIRFNLVELGMIKNLRLNDKEVLLDLFLPFLNVPIKEQLIKMIETAIKKIDKDLNIKINIVEMNIKEKEEFMKMARRGWKL